MENKEDILKELTEKQKAFCREYTLDWNGKRAYMAAYPDSSEEAATTSASRLLTNAKVKEYIEYCKNNIEEMAGISKMKVVKEQMAIAFSNFDQFKKDWMTLKDYEDLTAEAKACISEIQHDKIIIDEANNITKDVVRFKLYDKQKALSELSKMLGYNKPEEGGGLTIINQITGMQIK